MMTGKFVRFVALNLWRANMKISWSRGANVVCFGKVFNDGWGAIVWLKNWKKPWIWKMTKRSGR